MAIENPQTIAKKFPGNLPRLPREYYQGDAVVMWTLTTFDRADGWLSRDLHATFREILLHTLARQELVCPIYCLMPDHLHFVWMGISRQSDQLKAMAFFRTHLEPALTPTKLQSQAHDHVLREEERRKNAFMNVCFYIAENPVRGGLTKRSEEWEFSGCLLAGYPRLNVFEAGYWGTFWNIYSKLKEPDAGEITKPQY